METTSIGFIGAGLMGHGVAANLIVRGGHRLAVMGHRNRTPIDDLIARGAREATDPADAAAGAQVVFLCLPSSVEVEAMATGPRGLLGAMAPGTALIDMTTADPAVTRRLGAEFAARGVGMPSRRRPLFPSARTARQTPACRATDRCAGAGSTAPTARAMPRTNISTRAAG